ncbi:MAG: GlsB/YeaQ/YmgE family stress response membrane protein [Kofleriaceae bacterium]
MHIVWTLLIGFAVGAVARLLLPDKDAGGAMMTVMLGVAGAFIVGSLGRAGAPYGANEQAGLIASVFGAVVVLAGYRLIAGGEVT